MLPPVGLGADMLRREFLSVLGGVAVTWPLAARAQQANRVRRIGVLTNFSEGDREGEQRIAEMRKALANASWVEGHNLTIVQRWTGSGQRGTEALAKELIELQPDAIVCVSTPATAALLHVTSHIPIVFVNLTDPVGQGFVKSLAKP